MRGNDNHAENMETVETAEKYLGKGVVAIDLAGAEGLFPTKILGIYLNLLVKNIFHLQYTQEKQIILQV